MKAKNPPAKKAPAKTPAALLIPLPEGTRKRLPTATDLIWDVLKTSANPQESTIDTPVCRSAPSPSPTPPKEETAPRKALNIPGYQPPRECDTSPSQGGKSQGGLYGIIQGPNGPEIRLQESYEDAVARLNSSNPSASSPDPAASAPTPPAPLSQTPAPPAPTTPPGPPSSTVQPPPAAAAS